METSAHRPPNLGRVFEIPDWRPRPLPSATPMEGRTCRLERLDPARHGGELWRSYSADVAGHLWTHLPYGPFGREADLRAQLDRFAGTDDPLFFAILDKANGKASGVASYLRIDPDNGVIEVGHISYAPVLQRTVAATEAMALMMTRVFEELGYRRYEWKCDAANQKSVAAARRLGFTFEGVFRQAAVIKGRNRDTAWFSILDQEWQAQKARFAEWLRPDNFDGFGNQRRPLARPGVTNSLSSGC